MRAISPVFPLLLTAASLMGEGAWTPQLAFAEMGTGTPAAAALSPSAQPELDRLLAEARQQWAFSYRPSKSETENTQAVSALQAYELSGSAAKLSPTSAAAQIAVAESGARLAYIGGIQESLPRGVAAARALGRAKDLGAEAAAVDLARARQQLYLPQLLGGSLRKAAKYFETKHAEDPAGGWNAYFCAEAFRQLKQKTQAKAWYQKAQAMGHPLAADALDRMSR